MQMWNGCTVHSAHYQVYHSHGGGRGEEPKEEKKQTLMLNYKKLEDSTAVWLVTGGKPVWI